jgi:hypothetical protein
VSIQKCAECGRDFTPPSRHYRRFCSLPCRERWHAKYRYRRCLLCRAAKTNSKQGYCLKCLEAAGASSRGYQYRGKRSDREEKIERYAKRAELDLDLFTWEGVTHRGQ